MHIILKLPIVADSVVVILARAPIFQTMKGQRAIGKIYKVSFLKNIVTLQQFWFQTVTPAPLSPISHFFNLRYLFYFVFLYLGLRWNHLAV